MYRAAMNSDAFGRGREASKVLAMDMPDELDFMCQLADLDFMCHRLDEAVADARAGASPTPSATPTPTTPTTPATLTSTSPKELRSN